MKKVAILGSTGSIGRQALEVIEQNSDILSVYALSCDTSIELLEKQIDRYRPKIAVVSKERDASMLASKYPDIDVSFGKQGLIHMVRSDCDVVLNSLVGMRGMVPTYEAISAGKDVALANKETLVAGGEIIMDAARKNGIKLTPIDSEHSAIFQCLEGIEPADLRRLIITGSGGPFRRTPKEELKYVTKEMALDHPNWSMGDKITIDSATLMNKGLEVIEARWLFGIPVEKIDVIIHPQSVIHSMVETIDGAVLAQMGTPDMKLPIAYALTHPRRKQTGCDMLDLVGKYNELTFEEPDTDRFPCLKLAMQAIKNGGTLPAVMNAANEVLVENFLEGKISFTDIAEINDQVMQAHTIQCDLSIDTIIEADRMARELTNKIIEREI